MPVLKRTIDLIISGDEIKAVDENTGLDCNDAGVEGEDSAVILKAKLPDCWADLEARLSVTASDGTAELSGLAQNGELVLPLRSRITVPGRLLVTITGSSQDGVRRTIAFDGLEIKPEAVPIDPIKELYPIAFDRLEKEVKTQVVRSITGSGGAAVTKTGDTSYNIAVTGTGGDMLTQNYAKGSAGENHNAVDHALFADTAATVASAENAEKAETAAFAQNFEEGSALAKAIESKQEALISGGSGEEVLNGNTIRSIDGAGIDVSSDDTTVLLTLPGSVIETGMIAFSGSPFLPSGFLYANGDEVKIADYLPLYSKIAFRFGKGRRSFVEVTVSCLAQNLKAADNITTLKYTNAIADISFFQSGGTQFSSGVVKLYEPGDYTFYCRDSSGKEAVQYIYIPPLTDDFLLNLASNPDPANLKNTVTENALEAKDEITSVKLAAGIRTADYFLSAGSEIGTKDAASAVFSEGTTLSGGVYTFYAKSSSCSQIQYINAVTTDSLSLYLSADYGSEYFRLPDLYGKLGDGIIPCIRT